MSYGKSIHVYELDRGIHGKFIFDGWFGEFFLVGYDAEPWETGLPSRGFYRRVNDRYDLVPVPIRV